MANEILSTTTSSDQEKFLAAKLLERSLLKLVCASLCDKVEQPNGTGTTANFVRYARMNVPLVTLTEATTPGNSSFSLQTVTVTLDQWGDVITVSDVSMLTTSHPLMQQITELLADNAQRVIDREVQLVWLAGTNIQYGDGSVTARVSITSSMTATDAIIHKARVTMVDNQVPARNGPAGGVDVASADSAKSINAGQSYVAVCGPQVMADVMKAGTSLGTWASVAMYANQKALYNSEVGTWLGIRWVETNFIPKFQLLGNSTAAVTSGAAFGTNTPVVTASTTGGALAAGTYFYKVSRKDLTRGFEEFISIAHSTAVGGTTVGSFSFNFSSLTAGFVYNLYFDATGGGGTNADSNLLLVQANIAVGTTVTVTAAQTTGASAPANILASSGPSAVHPVYIHGESSCNWVALQNLQVLTTPNQASIADPLNQRRSIGYKFMAKAMIRNQQRILRLELATVN